MQERYLGDIHDYFKFLFLKFLSINLKIKIGLNWFLVNPKEIGSIEMAKNDGEKRNYIEKPEFIKYDMKLIRELSKFKDKRKRNVEEFCKLTTLKRYINFFNCQYIDTTYYN